MDNNKSLSIILKNKNIIKSIEELIKDYQNLKITIPKINYINPENIEYNPKTDQEEIINKFLKPMRDNFNEITARITEAYKEKTKKIEIYNLLMQEITTQYNLFINMIKESFPDIKIKEYQD